MNLKSQIQICLMALLTISPVGFCKEVTLASIANLDHDEFRTDEGNEFRLIQLNQGCKIEARFYVSFENTLYSYIFNQSHLISGTEKKFRCHYQKDHEGSLLQVADVYQYSSARYDLNDPVKSVEIKKDFMHYKALFSQAVLSQC